MDRPDYFNLKKLSDLPPLGEIKDFDAINPDLFEALEKEKNQDNSKAEPNDNLSVNVGDPKATNNEPEDDVTETAKVIPFSN